MTRPKVHSAVQQIPGLKAEVDTGCINIDEGISCLKIERRNWRNGEPITAVRLVHPGPLYDLIA